jgi:hypothetical protein
VADDGRREFSTGAWKRLDKTRNSRAGWGQDHYERLFTAFGFAYRDGGEHRVYWDPEDKQDRVSVPRHGELKAYVAELAVAAIDRMLRRKGLCP